MATKKSSDDKFVFEPTYQIEYTKEDGLTVGAGLTATYDGYGVTNDFAVQTESLSFNDLEVSGTAQVDLGRFGAGVSYDTETDTVQGQIDAPVVGIRGGVSGAITVTVHLIDSHPAPC